MKENLKGSAFVVTFNDSMISLDLVKIQLQRFQGFYLLEGFNFIVIEQTEKINVFKKTVKNQYRFMIPSKTLNISEDHRRDLFKLLKVLPESKIQFAEFTYSVLWSE